MGLYGQDECIFNKHVSNPFYLIKCENPEVEREMMKGWECDKCKKSVFEQNHVEKIDWALSKINSNQQKAIYKLLTELIKGNVNIQQIKSIYGGKEHENNTN